MVTIQLDCFPSKTHTPILSYCRKLIAEGVDPDTELHVNRGDILAIKVRTIKEGAGLTVQENEYGTPVFRPYVPKKNRPDRYVAGPVHAFNSQEGTLGLPW